MNRHERRRFAAHVRATKELGSRTIMDFDRVVPQEVIDWAERQLACVPEGDHWISPRCGLEYVRRGRSFALIARHGPEEETAWLAFQEREFYMARRVFAMADIEIVDETGGGL